MYEDQFKEWEPGLNMVPDEEALKYFVFNEVCPEEFTLSWFRIEAALVHMMKYSQIMARFK